MKCGLTLNDYIHQIPSTTEWIKWLLQIIYCIICNVVFTKIYKKYTNVFFLQNGDPKRKPDWHLIAYRHNWKKNNIR